MRKLVVVAVALDLPPAHARTSHALGKLVHSEIDKWVPRIQSAGVVGE